VLKINNEVTQELFDLARKKEVSFHFITIKEKRVLQFYFRNKKYILTYEKYKLCLKL
jgi:hypothetical protein